MRGSISSQLRNSLQGLNIASELLEQAVILVTNDNLDLGCAVIEQAATDKVNLLLNICLQILFSVIEHTAIDLVSFVWLCALWSINSCMLP